MRAAGISILYIVASGTAGVIIFTGEYDYRSNFSIPAVAVGEFGEVIELDFFFFMYMVWVTNHLSTDRWKLSLQTLKYTEAYMLSIESWTHGPKVSGFEKCAFGYHSQSRERV